MYVCMEQKQTAGVTSGSLLAQSPRINFCHIIKALTAFGSPTIPPTKPTEPLTNPQWWILPSALLSLNHLDSTDSNYTERANCDCKLSTHATSRWCKSFDYIFYYFFISVYLQFIATRWFKRVCESESLSQDWLTLSKQFVYLVFCYGLHLMFTFYINYYTSYFPNKSVVLLA